METSPASAGLFHVENRTVREDVGTLLPETRNAIAFSGSYGESHQMTQGIDGDMDNRRNIIGTHDYEAYPLFY